MKLSLITISYNSEKTIEETFESVDNQIIEGFELEYIHVDGKSTDNTLKIASAFNHLISKQIIESDEGLYYAMNKGIALSTGDIIGFLNSDDTFRGKDVLKSIITEFENRADAEIIFGDINYVDFQGNVKRHWSTGEQRNFSEGWHPAHPAFYARKSLFEKYGGFDCQYTIAADFDLMFRFLQVYSAKAYYLPFVFVDMKLGGESNKSLKNILLSSKEFRICFHKYGFDFNRIYVMKRWLFKIMQRLNVSSWS